MDSNEFITLGAAEALSYIVSHDYEVCNELKKKSLGGFQASQFITKLADITSLERDAPNVLKVLLSLNCETFFNTVIDIVHNADLNTDIKLETIQSAITIFYQLLARIPSTGFSILGVLPFFEQIIKSSINDLDLEEEETLAILHEKRDTVSQLKQHILHVSVHTLVPTDKRKGIDRRKPPDDFRKISILPTTDDIFIPGDGKPFLRKHHKYGAYDDLDHYLDVQFRLLREDCVSQIRDGVMEYMVHKQISGNTNIGRLQDARLYKRTYVIKSEVTLEGRLHTIKLDPNHAQKIHWNSSSRLIYGTLLCMTPDDFQTIYFGVVIQSDRATLEKEHTFKVQFAENLGTCTIPKNVPITIVESSAYFEAYRHVLRCLQKMSHGKLPFERYIIGCKTDVRPPQYLLRKERVSYDMFSNMTKKSIYDTPPNRSTTFRALHARYTRDETNYIFDINNNKWPSADDLHLDDSQFAAFKAALSQEFVLIQGPPGTGKTYLGLQIAKALLRNHDLWGDDVNPDMAGNDLQRVSSPMLVVCYTNHALDQFMEGIIQFMDLTPGRSINKVVRVGSRCNNSLIGRFSIKNHRFINKEFINYQQYEEKMKELYANILSLRYSLTTTLNVVLNLGEFKNLPKPSSLFKFDVDLFNWLEVSEEKWTDKVRLYMKNNYDMEEENVENVSDMPTQTVDVETEDQQARFVRNLEMDDFEMETIQKLTKVKHGLSPEEQYDALSRKLSKTLSRGSRKYLEQLKLDAIRRLRETTTMAPYKVKHITKKTVWKLNIDERWTLYRLWVNQRKDQVMEDLENKEKEFENEFETCKRERQDIDKRILEKAVVIAMTTTGASRYQDVLHEISPKIIIVEEAAEVLEAHIVATLSPKCEHLILIGDHKQLEPKASVFQLALKYNLTLSMFERMIQNKLGFHTLRYQHRMRPEISQLVRPVYEKLFDNDNVFKYPDVKGLRPNVFLLKHENKEYFKEEGRSYSNNFEAEFVMRLCRYLIQQEYKPSQITVLTPYTGQMFSIRNRMPKCEFDGVTIAILDNYQGEEQDIVILSLVRSNTDGKIGFLDKENRICVALSRAKVGLYVIGNIDMLCRYSRKSKLWKHAVEVLGEDGVGKSLRLYCQNHPTTRVEVSCPSDFDQCPDGGCKQRCEFRLDCGHACRHFCHSWDEKHIRYQCEKMCWKSCENNHECKKQCHYPDPCDCPVKIVKELLCGHSAPIPCFVQPSEVRSAHNSVYKRKYLYTCKQPCENCCEREHECKRQCHFPTACNCEVEVEKSLACGHSAWQKCYKNPCLIDCQVIVQRNLPKCTHKPELACHTNVFTYLCEELETRELPCGHIKELQCHVNVNRYRCQERIVKTLPCGHEVHILCCEKHHEQVCKEIVTVKRSDCDHMCTIKCGDKTYCSLNRCTEKVTVQRLNCEHSFNVECFRDTPCSTARLPRYRLEKEIGDCREMVTKTFPCHHPQIMVACHKANTTECKATCELKCERLHVCNKLCHYPESCECTVAVEKRIPNCNHIQDVPCSTSRVNFKCVQKVNKCISPCGHIQEMECHVDPHDATCKTTVTKYLQCGHEKDMLCSESIYSVDCRQQVPKTLRCGHVKLIECCCEYPYRSVECFEIVSKLLRCGHEKEMECKLDVLGVTCTKTVTKTLKCGHEVKDVKCHVNISSLKCSSDVEVKHPKCGHFVKIPCSHAQKIEVQKQISIKPVHYTYPNCKKEINLAWPCGHKDIVQCHNAKTYDKCRRKCEQKLICGHQCKGSCEACSTGILHVQCTHECQKKLICGHSCRSKRCGSCELCDKYCERKCSHKMCSHLCMFPCIPCNKPCDWRCQHFSCTKLCSEICNRPRCSSRCWKRLPCGHFCAGYCGDPCPKKCRQCHTKEFFKKTDKDIMSVSFVQFRGCGHIFEGSVIDAYMDDPLTEKCCPECKADVLDHPRYSSVLKQRQNIKDGAKIQLMYMADCKRSIYFPLLSKSVLHCNDYVKKFGRFLFIKEKELMQNSSERLRQMKTFHNGIWRSISTVVKQNTPNLQNYFDIYQAIRKMKLMWQLASLRCRTMTISETESDDERCSGEDEDDYHRVLGIESTQLKLESFILEPGHLDNNYEDVESEINAMMTIISNEVISKDFRVSEESPRMPFLIDVHRQYWMTCKEGHIYCVSPGSSVCRLCSDPKFQENLQLFRRKLNSGDIDLFQSLGIKTSRTQATRPDRKQIDKNQKTPKKQQKQIQNNTQQTDVIPKMLADRTLTSHHTQIP